jgi:hypothetical protein
MLCRFVRSMELGGLRKFGIIKNPSIPLFCKSLYYVVVLSCVGRTLRSLIDSNRIKTVSTRIYGIKGLNTTTKRTINNSLKTN